MKPFLIYGAYGYTGRLIVRRAVEMGMRPVLAGRNRAKIGALGRETGFEVRVFALDTPSEIDQGLAEMEAVLNCAGPFCETALPMAQACLRTGVHYLDITGEIEVIESLAALDGAAKEAGVMILPGVGADVVPSDCLALYLKQQLPSAAQLTLAFASQGGMSHGTAVTAVPLLSQGAVRRRGGQLCAVPFASETRPVDFGAGPRSTMLIRWGDVASAYYSTGIPDIEVFMAVPRSIGWMAHAMRHLSWLFGKKPVQRLIRSRIREGGPSDADRAAGEMSFWGEVRDAQGRSAQARTRTPDGYTLTAVASLHIMRKVLEGGIATGFATPAKAYGADLALELEGVTREPGVGCTHG